MMNKTLFNLLFALIIGLITVMGSIFLNLAGVITVSYSTALTMGLAVTILGFILLTPVVAAKVKHICCEVDWADAVADAYQAISPVWRKSFWLLFGLINLAFLFHTINFMWGGLDWAAIRTAVNPAESTADGRFSAYWLQNLLFEGKILPVANNLWAFAGLAFAGCFLVKYWQLPQKTSLIVIMGLLLTVTPYTLSWLYAARNTLGTLWVPALSLSALLLSEKRETAAIHTYLNNFLSVVLFLMVLGTRFAAINFITVAILGKVMLISLQTDTSIKDAFRQTTQALANFTAALFAYVFILFLYNELGKLNTLGANIPFALHWDRLPEIMGAMLTQFANPLPFADLGYKAVTSVLTASALFALILAAPTAKASLRGLLLVLPLLFASHLSYFFNNEPIAAHPAQMTFFALPLLWCLSFALLITLGGFVVKRAGYILAVLIIFMGFVRIAYAEKVWKFGWDAETKLAERIITRLEKMPEFNIERKYKLLQVGEISLRQNYYRQGLYEQKSLALLAEPYYPAGAAKDAYNFFYQTDFLDADADITTASEYEIKNYLLNSARAWPAPESIFINKDTIVLILDEAALMRLQSRLK